MLNRKTIRCIVLALLTATVPFATANGSARSDLKAGYDALRRQDHAQAISLFTSAIASGDLRRPDLALAYQYRGVEYLKTERYDAAIADFDQAIQLEPAKFPAAYSDRGIAYRRKGDFTKAIADYTEAIRVWPDWHDWYLNRGLAYAANRQYTESVSDFGRALYYRPNLVSGYVARGDAYLALGRNTEALEDYRSALRLNGSLLDQYPRLAPKMAALVAPE